MIVGEGAIEALDEAAGHDDGALIHGGEEDKGGGDAEQGPGEPEAEGLLGGPGGGVGQLLAQAPGPVGGACDQ